MAPRCEVKRHSASGNGNDGIAMPLGAYAASNFAGVAQDRPKEVPPYKEAIQAHRELALHEKGGEEQRRPQPSSVVRR